MKSGNNGHPKIESSLTPLLRPISELSEDPANVRVHGDKNMEAINGSLRRFGQQHPIVVDADGVVISGNGRLAAARELGWSQIAVVESALCGVDRTAYAIADNRSSDLAGWDQDALKAAIGDLDDLDGVGFDDGDVADILGSEAGDVEEDEVPEVDGGDPVTRSGDLPRYVDVSCKRWMALTGDSPVRESDGAKFSELCA